MTDSAGKPQNLMRPIISVDSDFNGNNVTRFNPKTEQFTEYRIPQSPDHGYERFIAADPKGRVWFTEYFGDRIGFVDPSGQSTGAQIASVAH